ncbi:MAG: hypothetical protein MUC36_17765 [Planctomycetes bacterium]|jgi:hypothetical protein|nr:hypothetical protein [Planctomycetota bacterium]
MPHPIPVAAAVRWLLAMCVACAGALSAQDQEKTQHALRFHDIKAWRGTIVASGKVDPQGWAQLEAGYGAGKVQVGIDYTIYSEVAFELTEQETEPWVWIGKITKSRYESGYRATATHDGGDQESVFQANGTLAFEAEHEVRLEFHHDDTWSVRLPSGKVPSQLRERVTSRDGKTFRNQHDGLCYGMGSTEHHAFRPSGTVLFASAAKTGSFAGISGRYGMTPAVRWEYAVYLEPLAWDELRLEIEAPADYATWLPTTTPTAAAGRPLVVKARLVDKDGGQPKVAVSSFEWELRKTSREPGVALNWPVDAKDQRFDLELAADGGFFELRNENQELVRAVESGWSDTVKVVPFDWGGWSTLQVVAVTTDGRRILGKPKGGDDAGLRVPKRAVDSKIADAWRQRTGCREDWLDEDKEPVGDGNFGDGFSNYEEYRGFVMNRGHVRGKPQQKDLFVRNGLGRKLLSGIFMFTDISGLSVRYELREDEMPVSRVMNGNRSKESPRSSEALQHGLILDVVDGTDYSITVRQEGVTLRRPGTSEVVLINSDLMAPKDAVELAQTVAHELLHACGVAHHGEEDSDVVWLRKEQLVDGKREVWFEERPSRWQGGRYVFPNTPGPRIRIFDVSGREIVAGAGDFLANPQALFLGRHGQQHSGDVACVMRYCVAQAFVLPGRPNDRFLSPGEPRGTTVCAASAGTQFNAAGLPIVRYGAATRGACCHQICVRDDAPEKSQ